MTDTGHPNEHDVGITVFLADDNLIVREGVRALLSLEPDLTIVVEVDQREVFVYTDGAPGQGGGTESGIQGWLNPGHLLHERVVLHLPNP